MRLPCLGRAGEFQDPLADPLFQGFFFRPRALVGVGLRRERRELLDDEEVEVCVVRFLAD